MFHTDRGKEFDNSDIEEFLSAFNIQRSLSHKGTPHDNAEAETTYKGIEDWIYLPRAIWDTGGVESQNYWLCALVEQQ